MWGLVCLGACLALLGQGGFLVGWFFSGLFFFFCLLSRVFAQKHLSKNPAANQPQFVLGVGAECSRGAGPVTGHPLRAAPSTHLRGHSGSGSPATQGTHPCVSITRTAVSWAGCFQLSYLFGALG